MVPNFLVIGAAKAGTTSLYRYLRSHPEVFMPEKKELQFFPEEFNWHLGLEWYERHFAEAGDVRAIGEASTTYTRYPYSKGVPRRIVETLPDVRLIYLVRHPIERMRSQYQQHVAHGWESETSIERALLENPFYLDTSRYAMQIEQYLEYLPMDRLKVIRSEDLRHKRDETIREVYGFLGVDPGFLPPALGQEHNSTRWAARPMQRRLQSRRVVRAISTITPMKAKKVAIKVMSKRVRPTDVVISDHLRRELEDRLREDVVRLYTYMDGEFDGWGITQDS
jgi:sulfotransferase family protein